MKLQFTSKSKNLAKKFAEHVKAERNIDSSTFEKDGSYTVEYSIADCSSMNAPKEQTHPTYEDLSSLASYIMREMQYQNNWLASQISYLESSLYKHMQGHLPPIQGAEKMEKALTALGIAGDYEIEKRVVYASNRHGTSVEVDISAKK